jgi:hypothetical protein
LGYDWVKVFELFLEPDPGKRQRARELPLVYLHWDDRPHGTRARGGGSGQGDGILPHKEVHGNVELSEILTDFVATWLAENVPGKEARALADMLGRNLTLREAGEAHGVDFRRLQEYRVALAGALEEELR